MTQQTLFFWACLVEIICTTTYDTAAIMALFRPHLPARTAALLFWLLSFFLLFPAALAGSPREYVQIGFVAGGIMTGATFYMLWKYFDGSVWDKLLWFTLRDLLDPYLLALMLFEHLFKDINFGNLAPENSRQLWLFICMELVGLVFRILVIRVFVFLKSKHLLSDRARKIAGYVCVLFCAFSAVVMIKKVNGAEINSRGEAMLAFTIYGICIAVAVKIIYDTLENRRLAREVSELSAQKQAQYDLFMARLAGDEETRRVRHDLKGHIAVMESLLKEGDYDRAESYLEEFGRQQASLPAQPPRMENAVAGALIADKYLACQQEQIAFSVDGGISKNIGIPDVDLVCMLSNLLDNAIEACRKVEPPEKRQIILKLTQRAGCLFIRVENSKSGDPALKNGRLIGTTKENRGAHGLGGKIMQSIADRCGGTLEFQETEDRFTAIAMLCPGAEPERVSQTQLQ